MNECMKEEKLAELMGVLFAEYTSSGLDIDEYMESKLMSVRKDGKKAAEAARRMFAAIDENYRAVQSAKADGANRRDWLRGCLETALHEAGADRQRETVGGALAAAVDVLSGAPQGTTAAVPFEGIDAVDWVNKLDRSLAGSALVPLFAASGSKPAQEDE